MDNNWIVLDKDEYESVSEILLDEKFDKTHAFIDLLMLANDKDTKIVKRGQVINVKRGQLAISQDGLSERWGWSRPTVCKFLNELESLQQISQQKSKLISLISINNYESFKSNFDEHLQRSLHQSLQQKEQERDKESTLSSTSPCTPISNSSLKEKEKEKENKKEISIDISQKQQQQDFEIIEVEPIVVEEKTRKRQKPPFVKPTPEEVASYCKEKGFTFDPQHFWDYNENSGWTVKGRQMKDWHLACSTWQRNNKRFQQNTTNYPNPQPTIETKYGTYVKTRADLAYENLVIGMLDNIDREAELRDKGGELPY